MSNSSCFAVLRIGDAARDGDELRDDAGNRGVGDECRDEGNRGVGRVGDELRDDAGNRDVGDAAREVGREEAMLCSGREGDDGEGTTRSRSDGAAP